MNIRFGKVLPGYLVLSAIAVSPLLGQASQLARVPLKGPDALTTLLQGGYDVVSISPGDSADVIIAGDAVGRRLRTTGFAYTVIHSDLEKFFASRLEPGRDDMGGYMTFSEIEDRMNILHDNYSDIVGEPVSVGQTGEGRDIWAVKISDNPNDQEDEPEVMFSALIHCREVITAEVIFGVMDFLVANYGEVDSVTSLVDNRQIWFFPCLNPDGYAYNEQKNPDGGGLWRKNRRDNGDGTYGVDLNRNFGYKWGFDNIGSSPQHSSETYRGQQAFSEPETQAIKNFFGEHHITTSLGFHSWGNLCLHPYGYDYVHAPDRSLLAALCQRATQLNNYTFGTGWEAIYTTNGEADDWMYASDDHAPDMALTIEVGDANDSFWPSLDRVDTLVRANIAACIAVAQYADHPARVLRPPTPDNLIARRNDDGGVNLWWSPVGDDDNPPAGYRIRAFESGDQYVDDAEQGNLWKFMNFGLSQTAQHSGTYSYRIQSNEDAVTLTLREEIPLPDTIFAWVDYVLYDYLHHYLAVEISYDGFSWTPLPGLNTHDLIIDNKNLGPGLRGDSNGWTQTYWLTGGHAGDWARLRFRYYRFGERIAGEMAFIDDIGPFPTFQWNEIVADSLTDSLWTDEDGNRGEDVHYQIQAFDADGDASFWSKAVRIGPAPTVWRIAAPEGWSLVGYPISPLWPAPERIFAGWVMDSSLIALKDGAGNLFAPAQGWNNMGAWNPLSGYLLKLSRADTLTIVGDLTPSNSAIPLEAGWNLVAYLPDQSLSDSDALASIGDNLFLAKNGAGDFWAPYYDYDQLHLLNPGEGYWLNVSQSDTLVYPTAGLAAEHPTNLIATRPSEHSFGPYSHSLILQVPQSFPGGEIVLLDRDGSSVNRVTIPEDTGDNDVTTLGLAAYGETSPNTPGYAEGESMALYWKSDAGDDLVQLQVSLVSGTMEFARNGFSAFSLSTPPSELPNDLIALRAEPNPFNNAVRLEFHLAQAARVALGIYDVQGREVCHWTFNQLESGRHQVVWNSDSSPSGVYFARLSQAASGANSLHYAKLLLLR